MAIAKGQVSTEAGERKLYIGYGSVVVKGVCPTKAELEAIYDRPQEKDPEYIGEADINGVKVAQARIDFIVKTDPAKNEGIETTQKISLFLRNRRKANKDNTKFQVIDKYGRTAWATEAEAASHTTTFGKNEGGTYQANISPDYRFAYDGEEQLVKLIQAWLNIPNITKFENGKPVGQIDNPSDAEVGLDQIANYFKGDFSELRNLLSYQPDNKFKVAFGVKTTDDNKQYQAFYTELFMKNGSSNFSKLKDDIAARKEAGSYPTTEFRDCPLQEYVNTPTPVEPSPAATPTNWFNRQ